MEMVPWTSDSIIIIMNEKNINNLLDNYDGLRVTEWFLNL